MKEKKNKSKVWIIILAVLLGLTLPAALYGAAAAVTGDALVLISKDYLDNTLIPSIDQKNSAQDTKLDDLTKKYSALLEKYDALSESYQRIIENGALDGVLYEGFVSVKIPVGKAIYPAGENRECIEVILQRGSAKIVFPLTTQGILDATTGEELMDGADVPANHFLIFPHANDGRAIAADGTEVWVLVRGGYIVE